MNRNERYLRGQAFPDDARAKTQAFRARFPLQPAIQHRNKTPQCPSFGRIVEALLADQWMSEERTHIAHCAYCIRFIPVHEKSFHLSLELLKARACGDAVADTREDLRVRRHLDEEKCVSCNRRVRILQAKVRQLLFASLPGETSVATTTHIQGKLWPLSSNLLIYMSRSYQTRPPQLVAQSGEFDYSLPSLPETIQSTFRELAVAGRVLWVQTQEAIYKDQVLKVEIYSLQSELITYLFVALTSQADFDYFTGHVALKQDEDILRRIDEGYILFYYWDLVPTRFSDEERVEFERCYHWQTSNEARSRVAWEACQNREESTI